MKKDLRLSNFLYEATNPLRSIRSGDCLIQRFCFTFRPSIRFVYLPHVTAHGFISLFKNQGANRTIANIMALRTNHISCFLLVFFVQTII